MLVYRLFFDTVFRFNSNDLSACVRLVFQPVDLRTLKNLLTLSREICPSAVQANKTTGPTAETLIHLGS